MRVLFVCDTYYPHINGVYSFVRDLATGLQNEGHIVGVIAPSETIHYEEKFIDKLSIYGIPSIPNLYYKSIRIPLPFKLKHYLTNIIKNFKPDIIHIQNHFILNKAVIKVNGRFAIPVVATNHFMEENLTFLVPFPKWKRTMAMWLWAGFSKVFNEASIVTTPTETGARLIRSKLNVKVIAISNGVDLVKYNLQKREVDLREKFKIPHMPILLSVGRLDPEKCIDQIIQAAAIALKKIDFCLVLTGKGIEKEKLEFLARKLGISDNVVFTGFVPDDDLPHLYKLADAFITASIAELQSIATMEAMASGLPIIAANAGALEELVSHGENGYLFNSGDINRIANLIITLFSDHDLCSRFSDSSLKFIQKHSIKLTLKNYQDVYKTVLN